MILDCYINEDGTITISIYNKEGLNIILDIEDLEMLDKFNDMLELCIAFKKSY